jgi:hypothetical protein
MAQAGQERGKVFYGWWVVLAAGVGLLLTETSQMMGLFK